MQFFNLQDEQPGWVIWAVSRQIVQVLPSSQLLDGGTFRVLDIRRLNKSGREEATLRLAVGPGDEKIAAFDKHLVLIHGESPLTIDWQISRSEKSTPIV